MESWTLLLSSLSIALLLYLLLRRGRRSEGLPPGPPAFPLIGNLFWLRRSFADFEDVLHGFRLRYGPLVTVGTGSRRTIYVCDRVLAHQMLVQQGAAFADRPRSQLTSYLRGITRYNINASTYGPKWRALRRNLTSEILHPLRVKHFGEGRERGLEILLDALRGKAGKGDPVTVVESFQFAMFSLLVFMCFGEMLGEKAVQEIEKVQRDLLLYVSKLGVIASLPGIVAKHLYRNRWETAIGMFQKQQDVFLPLIRARRELRGREGENEGENTFQHSYVDSLIRLEVPDDGEHRKLTDEEIVSLCSEFFDAGTDTTSTALQWIMANLVKHQGAQAKLFEEIASVVDDGEKVTEKDLTRMPYLRAVVMEGLRRHPPGHLVLPHAARKDESVEGYVVPRNASINFAVAQINWDAKVWPEPMEFRPERFLGGGEGEDVDITGSRELKMMTFGAGRRICPGLGLALLHLQYFVGNLVWAFEWKAVEEEEGVDLSEKLEFTVVMKNPLRARIFPRLPSV